MIVEKLISLAKKSRAKIAIGVGEDPEYVRRTTKVAKKAVDIKIAEPILIGLNPPDNDDFTSISSKNPEKKIIEMLLQNKVDGIVRGSLSSTKFLEELKKQLKIDILYRLAILETADSHQFLFAPVGIDECRNVEEKLYFVIEGKKIIEKLGITSKIGILSSGREEDKNRGEHIAKLINDAIQVVKKAKTKGIENIKNYNILIEDAIKDRANLIIGPDGISGNLIYRSLVHLGRGRSHGAIYLGLKKPVIDTSRVGPEFEYFSAIAFASALKVLD